MDDLYTVPPGVDLTSSDVRCALEVVLVSRKSYLANGALNHVFRDQRTGLKLFVVENEPGSVRRLTEVVGDTALWCKIRAVVADVAAAPALRPSTSLTEGETVERTRYGDVIELVAA